MIEKLDKERAVKRVDLIALYVLGIFCCLYSAFFYNFAELNIQFPFLDFPIFVGEILFMFCILALFVRWKLSSIKLNRWHYLLGAYALFILVKAFYGYLGWGALAFRNSALFYYPLFAVIAYYFYRGDFFKNKFVYFVILSILVLTLFFMAGYKVFYFNYVALTLLLLLAGIKSRAWRIFFIFLIAITCYKNILIIFIGGRSILVGSFFACLFLAGIMLISFFRIKLRYKAIAALVLFVIFSLFIWNTVNRTSIKSLIDLEGLAALYKSGLNDMEYMKDFEFAEPPVKVYEENRNNPLKFRKSNSQPDYSDSILESESFYMEEAAVALQERSNEELVDIAFESIFENPQVKAKPRGQTKAKGVSQIEDEVSFQAEAQTEPIVAEALDRNKEKENLKNKNREELIDIILTRNYQRRLHRATFGRDMTELQKSILYRWLMWQEMFHELFRGRILGVDFGKPFRSKKLQLLRFDEGWKKRVGWLEPHNSYVHILYRAGIVGFLLIVAVLSLFVKMTITFVRNRNIKGMLLVSCLMYWLIIANFLVILELPYFAIPFWILFGMVYKYSVIDKNKRLKFESINKDV